MLNKIQNNVQVMKAEAKEIVNRQLSPSFKNSSLKHIDAIDHKALPPLFFKLKSKNQYMNQQKQRIRAKTHIKTEIEDLSSLHKKNSLNPPEFSSFKTRFISKEILALMPVESELLSTRFYGLYKQKKTLKTLESDSLPKIQSRKSIIIGNTSSRPSKERKNMSQIHRKKGGSMFVRELNIREDRLFERQKKNILLRDWLNDETGLKQKTINISIEDVTVEPWSIPSGEIDELPHKGELK